MDSFLRTGLCPWTHYPGRAPLNANPHISHGSCHSFWKFPCWKSTLTFLFGLIKQPVCLELNGWGLPVWGCVQKGMCQRKPSHLCVAWSPLPTRILLYPRCHKILATPFVVHPGIALMKELPRSSVRGPGRTSDSRRHRTGVESRVNGEYLRAWLELPFDGARHFRGWLVPPLDGSATAISSALCFASYGLHATIRSTWTPGKQDWTGN